MSGTKHPVGFRSEIDFQAGGATTRPENPLERAARLKRIANRRRNRILRKFQTEGMSDLLFAISLALKMAIVDGKSFPLHFNVRYIFKELGQQDTTLTERFTLVDAATMNDLWTGTKTWSIWLKILARRQNDEGIILAFKTDDVVFGDGGNSIALLQGDNS